MVFILTIKKGGNTVMLVTVLKRKVVEKLRDKEWIREKFWEVIGDIIMIVVGLVLGYYFKLYIL